MFVCYSFYVTGSFFPVLVLDARLPGCSPLGGNLCSLGWRPSTYTTVILVSYPTFFRNTSSAPLQTPTPNTSGLKLISWNVAGLNTPIKRKKNTYPLERKLQPQIVFLQETHWKEGTSHSLKAPWIGHCLMAFFHSKTRGVAILFHKSLPVNMTLILMQTADFSMLM